MWSKSNADKLKMELSGKREKQQQAVKNETVIDNKVYVKMDSGFLSDANLSYDTLSKENIEYEDIKHDTSPKDIAKTTLDSGLDIDESSLSELDVDQIEIYKQCSKNDQDWNLYFQQDEDGDTYVFLNYFAKHNVVTINQSSLIYYPIIQFLIISILLRFFYKNI